MTSKQKKLSLDVASILKRLSLFSESDTDSGLADLLGVSRQVLSGWKKRGAIPYEKIIEFAYSNDLSLNYILTGDEADLIEVPLEDNQVSTIVFEVIGDTLLTEIKRIQKAGGEKFARFLEGPQQFHYAALIYNRIVNDLPKGNIWAPEIDEEIKHLIDIKKRDFVENLKELNALNELVSSQKLSRIDRLEKEKTELSEKVIGLEKELATIKSQLKNEPLEKDSLEHSVSQTISGNRHQISGRDLINKGKK
ncbi:MAG: hypothetical protein BVN35_20320 [Proteobacteria bacterium ST_bin11]|nr:MAG: hypothetical protein BVN35_20320 [Proteobacteria bacterium ST_bin11]